VKALDARLLRRARQTRVYIAATAVLGVAAAGLVIAQAQLLAGAIAAAFAGRASLATLRAAVVALAVVIAGRALVAWATEAASYRASASVKSELRRRLLARAVQLGPRWLAGDVRPGEAPSEAEAGAGRPEAPRGARPGKRPPGTPRDTDPGGRPSGKPRDADAGMRPPGTLSGGTAGLTQLATEGIDALDGYFAGYLPQLVLAVVVPLAVLGRIGLADPLSAAVIALTLPLIPLSGALIGHATGDRARRRWLALARLAHHFADVVAGLPTLKVFGRAAAQRDSIAEVTGEYRRATLGTLRLAFLSSMVLELTATMSVALVATEIGLRLVYGHLDLRAGLLALILAPEAYLSLRQAGARFHASADGLAAADGALAVIEAPVPPAGRRLAPFPDAIRAEGIRVSHQGRPRPAPDGASLILARGEIAAVAGPSGSGKSTLIDVLLAFARPAAGRVLVDGPDGETDLAEIDPDAWRSRIAWVAQDPVLFPGTVESNIRLGWPAAPAEAVEAARRAAALDEIPLGKRVGEGGRGLSSGQRRRVALARALLPRPGQRPVLLLDEPTAGLDAATEARVIATLRGQAAAGRLILIVSHRPAVLAAADRVTHIGRAAAPQQAGAAPEQAGAATSPACAREAVPA
jgi:ATP-binding cassette, subfamily C, bacterial CydCD